MGRWTEERWQRRRRRKRVEEILGWIIVPPLVIGLWLAGQYVYDEFQEPIMAVVDAVKTISKKH